jgi:hypothetical protein
VSRCGVGNVCFLSHVSVSFPALVCLVVWVRVCQLWFVLTFGGFWAFWCSPVCSSVGARVCFLGGVFSGLGHALATFWGFL